MKKQYVRGVRVVRSFLSILGLLGLLDRWSERSRTGAWLRSLLAVYDIKDLVAQDVPWWPFNATTIVEHFLASLPAARVFEWGAGASTVWLAKRSASVTTVEHDTDWANKVRTLLPEHVTLLLVPPSKVEGNSTPILSNKRGFAGLDFSEYVTAIDRVTGAFDLIILDGRVREACLVRAIEHITPGGMIVFDNVERRRYRDAIYAFGQRLTVKWSHGLTPCLPYSTRTALICLAKS